MSAASRIIFINQSTGYLFADVVNAFHDKGYDCTLVTSSKSSGVDKLAQKIKIDTICAYDKSSNYKRLLSWVYGTMQIMFKAWFKYQNCELFIVSNPPFAPLLPIFFKNKYSLLIYDVYPNVLVTVGLVKEDGHFCSIWRQLNRSVFKGATKIYTLSKGMAECLSRDVEKNRITVIPVWSDQSSLHCVERSENKFIHQHGLQDKFIVLYSGNIGNTHRVETLIEVAERMKNNSDIHFVIIGEGGKKRMILDRIKELNLENVLLLPYQPINFLSHSLGAADIGVVTLDESAGQLSVPSKMFNMMAIGMAFLCISPEESEINQLVKEFQIGKVCAGADIQGMVDYIIELKDDPNRLRFYENNAREAALNYTRANAYKYVDAHVA